MMKNKLSVAQASGLLGVTAATVQNWLRLGRLESLSFDDVSSMKKNIVSGGDRLKSRRNKTALRGGKIYRGYIDGKNELLELLGKDFSENEIRVILTEAALRLFSEGENLTEVFLCGSLSIGCDRLIRDLLGKARPTKKTGAILSAKWKPDREQDILGFIYMSLLPLNLRRSRGAYYTPGEVVKKTVEKIRPYGKILDPCCGSGNFLLALGEISGDPTKLFAADIDPIAVALARINLYIRFPDFGIDYLYTNITESSFFSISHDYDAIVGNPPWGGSPEASGRFLCRGIELLKEGGRLSFVLPEALLSARKHIDIRKALLSKTRICSVDYIGDSFHGVNCPSVILSAEKSKPFGTKGCVVNSEFTVNTERGGDLRCLSMNVTDEEYEKLRHMTQLKNTVQLKGNARFALGIVTGNNSLAISNKKIGSAEPIIRGTDISPFCIAEPKAYAVFDPRAYQQCAPEEVYRAEEKIVYRFIGKRPVFAVDRGKRLTLNSCNIIIPEIKGIGIDYITAVLNSSAVGFFLEKSFDAQKWLRWHLEEVPIPVISPERQLEICRSGNWDELIDKLYFND